MVVESAYKVLTSSVHIYHTRYLSPVATDTETWIVREGDMYDALKRSKRET